MELEKSSKIRKLEKNLKSLIEGNIIDLVVFGSFVKGKYKPGDVDLAILVKDEDNFNFEELSKIRERSKGIFKNIDTEVLSPSELYTTNIGLRILLEGYSLKKRSFLSDILNIRPYNIYSYSLENLNNSEKTQFNRSMRQILEEVEGEKMGRGVVKVLRKDSGKMEEIFKRWDVWKDTDLTEIFQY